MADGEDGYGSAGKVGITVRRFKEIGTAGINIEDQVLGNNTPKKLIDAQEMVDKVIAARESAGDAGFIINARTDALLAYPEREKGLAEAIRRMNMYLDAGADLVFPVYAATLEEVKTIVNEVSGPVSIAAGLPYNISAFSINDLRQLGITRVSLPMLLILSMAQAGIHALGSVRDRGDFADIIEGNMMCSPKLLRSR